MESLPTRGVTSETGVLRTVLLHRPGHELSRLTPRNNDKLLFDGIPWVARAQEEHDAFAELLTGRGVEVLYLTNLLSQTLASAEARHEAIEDSLTSLRLGEGLRAVLRDRLNDLGPTELTEVLTSGLRNDELTNTRTVVTSMLAPEDFIIDPLPNLLFTRDSSLWLGKSPVITALALRARRRESTLTRLIYRHHPRFAQVTSLYGPEREHVEGGDVLVLGHGVVAVGVGQRTTPAGAESLARSLFAQQLAHTVLAVPIDQTRATMHLDTICTMVNDDTVVMYPKVANKLTAFAIRPTDGDDVTVDDARPFLEVAAAARGIEAMHVIGTQLDPVTAEREQWDDGNNTLALAPNVCVAYERNTATNHRLEQAGIEVLTIPGSELGSGRGGPRCMSCPIDREDIE